MQGLYWPVICCSFSFGTVFFLSKHYTNSQIGVVLAVGSILSVLVQPAAASYADSSARISMKQLLMLLTAAGGSLAALRFFFTDFPIAPAVFFILEEGAVYALQPLVNSLGVRVMNRGAEIYFGLSRGVGSIVYAGVSIVLGLLLKTAKSDVLPLFSIAFYIALGVAVMKFPVDRGTKPQREAAFLEGKEPKRKTAEAEQPTRKRNGRFLLLLVAVVFAFCSQSMIGSFLIQIMERVGGTAENVGITNGLAAAIELPAMAFFGVLIKKFRSGTLLKVSFVIFILKAAATALSSSVALIYATQILQFGAYALFIPSSVYYANEVIPESSLAKGQAALTSAATLGGVAANLLGGRLLDIAGVGTMLGVSVFIASLGCVRGLCAVEKTEKKF